MSQQVTTVETSMGGYRTRALAVRGAGPLVVLLHGYGDWADTWRGVLDCFAARGRAAVAYDLPGFGRAAARPPGPMLPHLDAFADALLAEHVAEGPVAVVGNSLGALTAVRLAARHGASVGAVVAVDEPALGGSLPARLMMAEQPSWLLRAASRDLPLPRPVLHAGARAALGRGLYADRRRADPRDARGFVERLFATHATGGGVLREIRGLAMEVRDPYSYADVVAPLLVVHGAKDRIIPVRASRRLHRAVPGSELVVLPHCGHCPQLDDPVGLTGLVLDFLQRRCG